MNITFVFFSTELRLKSVRILNDYQDFISLDLAQYIIFLHRINEKLYLSVVK